MRTRHFWGAQISSSHSKTGIIDVKTYQLSSELKPYFSALYKLEVRQVDAAPVLYCHYPDWTSFHFLAEGEQLKVGVGDEPMKVSGPFSAKGPTSRALPIRFYKSHGWSFGLNPVGWARFGQGAASGVANCVVDGSNHPQFAMFAPVLDIVRATPGDDEGTARRIDRFLRDICPASSPHEEKVVTVHEALRNPEVGDVETLSEQLGYSRRTLERLSARFFGFPPKTLLRRQRFVRSLGKFLADPERSWSASLDGHYVDQAHFVREFRAFMGMTPSGYAQIPHPFLETTFNRRLAEQAAHTKCSRDS